MAINANKQIEAAMKRGEFSNLPGNGKPLQLDTNPYLTPQARTANRLLKANGFAPRWVELEKEIRQEKAQLEKILINLKARRERLAALISEQPRRREAIHQIFETERARGLERYREKLEAVNRKIQRVNLLMPTRNRQYPLLNATEAVQRFADTCPELLAKR